MKHAAWCAHCNGCRIFITKNPAGSVRLAAKAPAGCTVFSAASWMGRGKIEDLDLLGSVADNIQGNTICALGDAAAMPVRSFVKHFRHEFETYIRQSQETKAG